MSRYLRASASPNTTPDHNYVEQHYTGRGQMKKEWQVIIIDNNRRLTPVDDEKDDRQSSSFGCFSSVGRPVRQSASQTVSQPGGMRRRLRRMEAPCSSVSTLTPSPLLRRRSSASQRPRQCTATPAYLELGFGVWICVKITMGVGRVVGWQNDFQPVISCDELIENYFI